MTNGLQAAGVALRVVGIGDQAAGQRFSDFTGLPLEALRLDPVSHAELEPHIHI